MTLSDDLQQSLEAGTLAPEVLPDIARELQEIADALDTAAPIPLPQAVPLSPREDRTPPRRDDLGRTLDEDMFDDDIPF